MVFCLISLGFLLRQGCEPVAHQLESEFLPLNPPSTTDDYHTVAFNQYDAREDALRISRREKVDLQQKLYDLESGWRRLDSENRSLRGQLKELSNEIADARSEIKALEKELADSISRLRTCEERNAEVDSLYQEEMWQHAITQDSLLDMRAHNQILQWNLSEEREKVAIAQRTTRNYLIALIVLVSLILVTVLVWLARRKGWLTT